MVIQLTVRDVPIEDVAFLKREAASKQISLNSLLRGAIGAEAEQLRRREALTRIMNDVDERRARIAERVGGVVPDSVELIREDRVR